MGNLMMIKEHKFSVFAVLRFLTKYGLVVLRAMVYFIAEEQRARPRYYSPSEAKELSDKGLISNAEYARSLRGSD